MPIARHKQVRLEVTRYYHCSTRCVRRSFLCGKDALTGKSFEHRRKWIEDRLISLAEVFCIDVLGYAVMSNHYHVVLHVNVEEADALTDQEVLGRWLSIRKGPELARRAISGEPLSDLESEALKNLIKRWRGELANLSCFMGNINEFIARRSNKEDDCKGTFWEKRFESQAVLDLPALISTMCYVDLNPVRAKMAKTPEESQYTSVYRRLKMLNSGLVPFRDSGDSSTNSSQKIPFKLEGALFVPLSFEHYLEILDWTGRQIKKGKRGAIDSDMPPIMERLGYTPKSWFARVDRHVGWRQRALGEIERIGEFCKAIDQKWIWLFDRSTVSNSS